MFEFNDDHLKLVAKYPHLIGVMAGKTKLTKMHSEWIKDAWKGNDHTALQAHRGSYKTTAGTETGSIWWLLFHPNDRIGLGRKTFSEAANTIKTIAKYMEIEEIVALFTFAHKMEPKAIVARDSSLVYNFKTTPTKEGSIDAHGIDGGGWTGTHYDIIVLDDIVTLKDRLSKAERERTKEGVREIYTNIIDPGKKVIHFGTPWHKDDAWNLKGMPEPKKYDCYTTGILTPEQIEEKKTRTTGPLFAANFELRHTSTEDMIFKEVAGEEPWIYDHSVSVYAHLDAKFSGNHHNALTLMAKKPNGRIQAKGWVFTDHVEDKVKWIQEICSQHRIKKLYIERNPDKGYTGKALAKQSPDLLNHFIVEDYHESMNKTIKIATHLKGRWADIDWDINTESEYLNMILDYREFQEPDDAPDSAASLVRAQFPINDGLDKNLSLYELD